MSRAYWERVEVDARRFYEAWCLGWRHHHVGVNIDPQYSADVAARLSQLMHGDMSPPYEGPDD